MSVPLWARLVLRASRAAATLHRAQEIFRDELLFAYLPPSSRAAFTVSCYELEHCYLSGGAVFELGLFEWEKALLDASLLPASGRVLLGAAGGGRELMGLAERGYAVSAFEPALELFQGAQQVASRYPACQVLRGSYADLCARAEGRENALSALDLDVDLIWLGWGSLSHLTVPDEPLGLLRALRTLVPKKLVVLSYAERGHEASKGRGARRLREALRRMFQGLGGAEVPEGLECYTAGGFQYAFSVDEISELATQAGYRVILQRSEGYPHAVLAPAS